MAPALLGVHRDVVCADCGCPFPCDAEARPAAARAACPNCGYATNDLESLPDAAGERVLIDRAVFGLHPPRRWEVVACRRPGRADEIVVKRVVGLPGESVAIRGGDVYIDGKIRRKSLAEQRALAILVCDANFQPSQEPTPPPRWRAARSDSRWTSAGGRFTRAAGTQDEPLDWLEYHHWQRLIGVAGGVKESPVTDVCSYNPARPRREEDVHAVADLLLSFRVTPGPGRGVMVVRATDGNDDFEARLDFGEDSPAYQVLHQGWPLPDAAGRIPARRGTRLIEVSLVDQQFLMAIDGETLVAHPYERADPAASSSCPLAIGTQGIDVTVADLRVYRDVYYTRPIGGPATPEIGRPVRLGESEYFVLGDNSPISEDSRIWSDGGAIDAKWLVGKPLLVIPAISIGHGGHVDFQVPNPAGIRYIR